MYIFAGWTVIFSAHCIIILRSYFLNMTIYIKPQLIKSANLTWIGVFECEPFRTKNSKTYHHVSSSVCFEQRYTCLLHNFDFLPCHFAVFLNMPHIPTSWLETLQNERLQGCYLVSSSFQFVQHSSNQSSDCNVFFSVLGMCNFVVMLLVHKRRKLIFLLTCVFHWKHNSHHNLLCWFNTDKRFFLQCKFMHGHANLLTCFNCMISQLLKGRVGEFQDK